ncbi:MAG TPA: hypothetical protein VJ599_01210 [Nitrososphaeraceae archaeon]|nr:hypothetical protein [Nitrososphaeraceae archaeon]
MAIRSSIDREKKKQKDEEKNKAPSVESSNLVSNSNTNFKDKPSQQDNARSNNKDTKAIPKVFDSSKYDSMKEMKESSDMKGGEVHLKEVLSSVEKEKPIEPTTTETKLSTMDTNSPSAVASATVDASPPNLEERAATLRSTKEEHIVENSLAGSKKESQKGVMVTKDKETNTGPHISSPKAADPYTILWQDAAKFWNDYYLEYARRASEMTRFWLDLFSNFWLFGYMK